MEGLKTLTDRWASSQSNGVNGINGNTPCGEGENCCKNKKSPLEDDGYNKVLYDSTEFVPYDPSQEPIFPPELQLNVNLDQQFMTFSSERVKWFRPTTLTQLLELKQKHSDAKIVVGNTELGVEVKFKHCDYPVYINPTYVPQLTQVKYHPPLQDFVSNVRLKLMFIIFLPISIKILIMSHSDFYG